MIRRQHGGWSVELRGRLLSLRCPQRFDKAAQLYLNVAAFKAVLLGGR